MIWENEAEAMSETQNPSYRDLPNGLAHERSFHRCPISGATEIFSSGLSRSQDGHLRPSHYQDFPYQRLRKMPKSSTLSVTLPHSPFMADDGPHSVRSPAVPKSSNRESFAMRDTTTKPTPFPSNFSVSAASLLNKSQGNSQLPRSPTFASLPPHPSSPRSVPSHAREPSHSFFSNVKASISSSRIEPADVTIRHVAEDPPSAQHSGLDNSVYPSRRTSGSTPDLSSSNLGNMEANQITGLSHPLPTSDALL